MAFEHILVVGGGQEKEGEARVEWRCVLSNLPLNMTHAALVSAPTQGLCLFVYSFVHSVSARAFLRHVCPCCLCVCVCL